jgi:AraC-like DNA-binding protein
MGLTYQRSADGSPEAGLKAMAAALSSPLLRTLADLAPRNLLAADGGRRPARRRPTVLPYPAQTHEHIEIACVIGGKCLVQVGERYLEVRQGDVCVFTPQVRHSDTFLRRNLPYSLLWFTLGSKMVGAHLTTYSRRSGFSVVCAVTCDPVISTPRLMKEIIKAVPPDREGALTHIRACLLELASIALNRLIQMKEAPPHDWRSKIVADVQEFLQAHYRANPSLTEISNRVRLSPNYLCALFRRHTGRTIFSHMNVLRMERAEDLLLNSDLSVKEVAREAGFHSAHYFSRAFHRTHGSSPLRFRAAHT